MPSNHIATSPRQAILLSYANALVWAVGNGLVSTTLIVYLVLELGAQGMAVSAVLAAPRLVGVLRLGVPALVARVAASGGGRQGICIASYLASGVVLAVVPFSAVWAGRHGTAWGITTLTLAWSVYHLLEYTATVTLWSWLGDLYPERLRSRLLGHRERWLVVGRIVGLAVSFGLATAWAWWLPEGARWVPLAASATLGALLLMLAVIPLLRMPSLAAKPSATPHTPWQTLRRAMMERPYRRLLAYSCCFGVANGLTTTAQGMYPQRVLGISYPTMLAMRMGMRSGQSAIAPWCGRAIARWGARHVMLPAQLLVATGPLFYWAATPDRWWILGGAFLVWIAYAAINVGLDTLKLNLADRENNSPYVALYHAMSDLAHAVTVLLGGVVYDLLSTSDREQSLKVYALLFLVGWAARTAVSGLILRLAAR